jgi:hypothetical protein
MFYSLLLLLLYVCCRYYFNDSSVTETNPENAINGSAYVLFYKRRKGQLVWGGLQPSAVPMPDEAET